MKKRKKLLIGLGLLLVIVSICFMSCQNQSETNNKQDLEVMVNGEKQELQKDDDKQLDIDTSVKVTEGDSLEEKSSENVKESETITLEKTQQNQNVSSEPEKQKENDTNTDKNVSVQKPTNSTQSTDTKKENSTDKKNENNTVVTQQPSKPVHTHNWVKKETVVEHEEEGHWENVCVKDAWTEENPVYELVAIEVCGNCGKDVTNNPGEHIKEHMLNGTGNYGCYTEYVQKQIDTEIITHEAVYKQQWIIDKEAWTETIITYQCSCGATK